MKKRGFITVATGDYYCRLAENLIISYRLFSDTTYPLYVMTDQKGEKRLKKYFDGVIVMENPTYTFLDKIAVYENSPFDETIFLDADMNIIKDISFLFDMFEENGCEVSCMGSVREITPETRPIHYGEAAVEAFHLTKYLAFGGGMYYYQRCQKTDELIRMIYDELIPHYHDYQMKVFRPGQMADEPLMGLAMLLKGMTPVDDTERDIMRYSDHMMDTLKWDFKAKKCTFLWQFKRVVDPQIVHYGTHNTYHKKYVYYNAIVRCKYRRIPVLIPFAVCVDETVLLFRHMGRESDRKAFFKWFKAHFTAEYWRNIGKRLTSKIKK